MRTKASSVRFMSALGALAALLYVSTPAIAQTPYNGFSVNRYQPTSAGEWSFFVDHPWYSSTRYLAVGMTLGYAHNPVVFSAPGFDGLSTLRTALIEHQITGSIDIAGSFLDRVQVHVSLPITFLETGTNAAGVTPANGVAMSDPHFGVWVRIFGQPNRSPVSLNLGAQLWVPIRVGGLRSAVALSSSDEGALRVLPKLVLAGYDKHLLWSFNAGFQYRPQAQLGDGTVDSAGSTVGSELQLGASVAYADYERGFAIGPEVVMATQVLGDSTTRPFSSGASSVELLVAGHYRIKDQVNLGLAGGIGQYQLTGTPDARFLFHVAYAPMRRAAQPKSDRDQDSVPDPEDVCPSVPAGAHSDPQRPGCPIADRDHDGILDPEDECPDEAAGSRPDSSRAGCPVRDRDGDGVLDAEDLCPDEAKGDRPDPEKGGCPLTDRDGDGIGDSIDQCPDIPMGEKADPSRAGCPARDRDGDHVFDFEDACPDLPGVPDPDPKKRGCPGALAIEHGKIKIDEPIYFWAGKRVILDRSHPVLEALAQALKTDGTIKKIRVEGHTDNLGKPDFNRALSAQRAKSVVAYLVKSGIAASRLEAAGYGADRPIADNNTLEGRERNRRVDFVILDPPQSP